MLDGVVIQPLRVIPDARGRLMEILRSDDPIFAQFGQLYLTTTYPGVVKAWHCHARQDDYLCCLAGMLRLALYDERPASPTRGQVQELVIGEHAPALVRVPRGIWHGWQALGTAEALVINCPTEPYDHAHPDELRRPWNDPAIPVDWAQQNG